jgi:hormone-sensitive lipase
MYTRLWSKGLNVPIVSVDYRLSPKYPYPAALDDCFQTYMWLVHYFSQVFKNTKGHPPKILLTGDSAGGNLIAGVTGLAIKLGVRIPDFMVMSYPALDLSVKNYTPSRLTCL